MFSFPFVISLLPQTFVDNPQSGRPSEKFLRAKTLVHRLQLQINCRIFQKPHSEMAISSSLVATLFPLCNSSSMSTTPKLSASLFIPNGSSTSRIQFQSPRLSTTRVFAAPEALEQTLQVCFHSTVVFEFPSVMLFLLSELMKTRFCISLMLFCQTEDPESSTVIVGSDSEKVISAAYGCSFLSL